MFGVHILNVLKAVEPESKLDIDFVINRILKMEGQLVLGNKRMKNIATQRNAQVRNIFTFYDYQIFSSNSNAEILLSFSGRW